MSLWLKIVPFKRWKPPKRTRGSKRRVNSENHLAQEDCRLIAGLPLQVVRYRSCGRDPAGCCVSDLLRDEPVVRSGREANYQAGKDTGRFWDAGASNVHWVIVKDDQVERGINEALGRIEADGVIVEGNSFLEYLTADLAIMCARAKGGIIKSSARKALAKSDVLYLSTLDGNASTARRDFEQFCTTLTASFAINGLPILTWEDFPSLLMQINTLTECNFLA